jgi:serine/threonine protein kinase
MLGVGGMGEVYKAKDIALGRLVALKVIRPELASNPAIIDRFKQEILLSSNVTHKNVIRIYDLGEADGMKFITMEYVDGRDLRGVLHEQGKFSPKEAIAVIRQVCYALEAAHAVGVIHRDLKPQNIMCEPGGRVLVMDFGLARTLDDNGLTQSGNLVGTLEYMSPEQALAKEIDQRSDIFALGIIFYELLIGTAPYQAHSAVASFASSIPRFLRTSPTSSPSVWNARLSFVIRLPPNYEPISMPLKGEDPPPQASPFDQFQVLHRRSLA